MAGHAAYFPQSDRGLGSADRAHYMRAPASEMDAEQGMQGQGASPLLQQGSPQPTSRNPRSRPKVPRKEILFRWALVAASTLLGLFLLFTTDQWKLLLMNLAFLPPLAVLLNWLVLIMKHKTVQQIDDVITNLEIHDVLSDFNDNIELVKSCVGEIQGKDLRVEASKMMKQAVADFTPMLMGQMSKVLEDVMRKQSAKLEGAIAAKVAQAMDKATAALEHRSSAPSESAPGKQTVDVLGSLKTVDARMRSFEEKVLATFEAQRESLETLASRLLGERTDISERLTSNSPELHEGQNDSEASSPSTLKTRQSVNSFFSVESVSAKAWRVANGTNSVTFAAEAETEGQPPEEQEASARNTGLHLSYCSTAKLGLTYMLKDVAKSSQPSVQGRGRSSKK